MKLYKNKYINISLFDPKKIDIKKNEFKFKTSFYDLFYHNS